MFDLTVPSWLPFADRTGRVPLIKLVAFLLCIAPAVWIGVQWQMGWLSPKPVTDILRQTGDWAMRILVLTLAITPLRFTAHWNRLYSIRRMLGVTALVYSVVHVIFWFWQQDFDWWPIVMEIVLRTYLSIGLAATLIMIVLGITSNDWGVRKLGSVGWNNLHWWVYPAAIASLVHYFMLIRLDAYEPVLMAGLLALSAGFRFLRKRDHSFSPVSLLGLAVLGGIATALIEAGYYAYSTGVDVRRLLEANFDFTYDIRPSWYVLGAGVLLALMRWWRKPAVAAKRSARADTIKMPASSPASR